VEIENHYEDAEEPEDVVIRASLSDISDEMAAHEAVRQREELFRRLAETLPIGLLQVEMDRSVVYANVRLRTILGVTGAGGLEEQLRTVTPDTREVLDAAFDEVLDRGLDQEIEVTVELPETGERRRCAVVMTALTTREGSPGALVTVNDVTESSRLREELRVKATYDTLTGCHNRASAMTLLDARLDVDRRTGATTAVVFIDLDHFKPINDRLGHAAGDQLLIVAGRRLRDVLREGDAVGRIGGDEFLLVCQGVVSEEQARRLAARVSDALHADVELEEGTVRLAGSIGMAVSTAELSADQIVALADAAMYESKRIGDGTPVLYDGERYTILRQTV
jgi:diguanylate cyclase (GGDEF)-like protein/PAS domain S-box-containing protein